ncbi:MAG: hypothetical protein NZ651_06920 [Candidatus Bipolaricaulota bacterium]|nr:hypothetical protein [Candidatus Bipolaricaulota bacterium]MDW8127485.1 hypothetical protein [Candidatus Bipolaricaulota bacterium]
MPVMLRIRFPLWPPLHLTLGPVHIRAWAQGEDYRIEMTTEGHRTLAIKHKGKVFVREEEKAFRPLDIQEFRTVQELKLRFFCLDQVEHISEFSLDEVQIGGQPVFRVRGVKREEGTEKQFTWWIAQKDGQLLRLERSGQLIFRWEEKTAKLPMPTATLEVQELAFPDHDFPAALFDMPEAP